MAKTPAMKNKGDTLVLQVARDEPVNIKVGGSGVFRVALQAEVGAPGSGSWRDIQSWSHQKEDDKAEPIEYSYSNAKEELQSLRLVVKEADKGASISASMEVPAEEEIEEEPALREKKEAEFVAAPEASVEEEEERRRVEAEAKGQSTSTTTSTTKTS